MSVSIDSVMQPHEDKDTLVVEMASQIQVQAKRLEQLQQSLHIAKTEKAKLEADFLHTLDMFEALQKKVSDKENRLQN